MRTVRWRFFGRCLTLSAQAADVGSSSVAVDIDYNGPTLEIGVSPEFMREGLKALEGEDIALELRTPSEAVSIRADDLLYVVMPVNLG